MQDVVHLEKLQPFDRQTAMEPGSGDQRPSPLLHALALLPTFLTAFFKAAALDRLVFFASYLKFVF
jgi:hypothetical protein